MIINKSLSTIIDYLSQFRFSWKLDSLSEISDSTKNNISNASKEYASPSCSFSLLSQLQSGWYMLEIKAKLTPVRVKTTIFFTDRSHVHKKKLAALPLFSNQVGKRLIYLNSSGKLSFNVLAGQSCFDLHYFRLVRVSQQFAFSRMYTKLRALHPRYKINTKDGRYDFDRAKLQTLWTDYGKLFDDEQEVIPYREWIEKFDTLNDSKLVEISTFTQSFSDQPLISIVLPVVNSDGAFLEDAITSICQQTYPNWELCIAVNTTLNPIAQQVLEKLAQSEKRSKVLFDQENKFSSALGLASGQWLVLFNQNDVLSPYALSCIVAAINQQPDIRLIYSDEDKMDATGVRSDPYFKCDWNPDLFYSHNTLTHLVAYQTSLVRQVGGFREELDDAQEYDLALRCSEHLNADQIHHIARILYHCRTNDQPHTASAGICALNDHFFRIGLNATAQSADNGNYRVCYALPSSLPLVSLIIPTRNGLELLKQCIESILLKTNYPNYDLMIVDNGSDDPATLSYLSSITNNPRISVICDARPFNYSALNNAAVRLVKGEVIGLINNDVEVINPEWLTEMVSHALRTEVGAVGARLWYTDDTIQHAGVILGIHGIAGHIHRFLPKGDTAHSGRAGLIQSISAVTAACLIVRKSVYEEAGGLNEAELQVACNDVDFCLRLRELGYRNVWTPYAELYHHESASRGVDDTPEKLARSGKEIAYMQDRWGMLLLNDPSYNPNLGLDNENFGLAWPPRQPGISDMLKHQNAS